jgi:16S rRNA processing protein RimM
MVGDAALPFADAVLLAVVVAAHGLKGEVKLKTFTSAPAALGDYGEVTTGDGRTFEIRDVRPVREDEAVGRFRGIADRNAAESLKGQRLYVPRSALPPPEEEEFYHADLVGLSAQDMEGGALGRVRGIYNFGAGDVLEIEDAKGATFFVPFTREAVPTVDVTGKRIVVVLPEDEGEPN